MTNYLTVLSRQAVFTFQILSEPGWPRHGVMVGKIKMDCTRNRVVRGREEVAMVRGRDFRAAKGVTWVGFVP